MNINVALPGGDWNNMMGMRTVTVEMRLGWRQNSILCHSVTNKHTHMHWQTIYKTNIEKWLNNIR